MSATDELIISFKISGLFTPRFVSLGPSGDIPTQKGKFPLSWWLTPSPLLIASYVTSGLCQEAATGMGYEARRRESRSGKLEYGAELRSHGRGAALSCVLLET